MLTYEDKKDRLPHILGYLSESPQRQKLLAFLRESKKVPFSLLDHLQNEQPQVQAGRLPEEKADSKGITCVYNGNILFQKPATNPVMRSLGKGEYSVPLSFFSETVLTAAESITDKQSSQTFYRLPNGLYLGPSNPQHPMLCVVEIRPSSLFYSFHSGCKKQCEVASLISPYPGNLCELMKLELEKKRSTEDLCLRINMTLEQSEAAITGVEQYGFAFSETLVTVDELFENSGPPTSSLLDLRILTCFSSDPFPTTEALAKLGQFIASLPPSERISPSVVFILVLFSPLVSASTSNTSLCSQLLDKNVKVILVELKQKDFENWFKTQKLIQTLTSVTVQI